MESAVSEVVSSEPAVDESELQQPVPVRWTPWTRFAFRMAFLYFCIFVFAYGNGSIFDVIPVVGNAFDEVMMWPMTHIALWVGPHLFHLKGIYATFHPTGSGDTAMDWILQLQYLLFAVGGALLWTAIAALRGHRRQQYATLYAWLRFGVRLTVGFFMLGYGLAKLFPNQMPPISVGILNEPVGQMSPMTMLWALIGLNPGYEMVCGAAEVIGGVLLLFRRTALVGALLSAFVMTNVLLYNMFFDVPVKLFAANLLLAALFIMLPDVKAMYSFFWLHQPSAPAGIWIPPVKRRGFRIATRVVELAFTGVFLVVVPGMEGYGWYQAHAKAPTNTALLGAWHLDATHPATGAFITAEGLPATDLYVDTSGRSFTRSTDLALWRTRLNVDDKAHTVRVAQEIGDPVTYAYQMPDADHMVLTSVAPKEQKDAKAKPFVAETVSLTRTPVMAHYPLLDRGFHWVNEWGLER